MSDRKELSPSEPGEGNVTTGARRLPKKAYATPVLVRWGSAGALTAAGGATTDDGGGQQESLGG